MMDEKEFASPVRSRTVRDIGPVLAQERIDVVDILRGFAIFGMVVVNFSHDLEWRGWFTKLRPGSADRFAYFLLHFFAAGKFHALFSFLFGWGFALQMDRANARGVRFSPLYARRLFCFAADRSDELGSIRLGFDACRIRLGGISVVFVPRPLIEDCVSCGPSVQLLLAWV